MRRGSGDEPSRALCRRGGARRGRHLRDELAVHRRSDRAGAGAAIRPAAPRHPHARPAGQAAVHPKRRSIYDNRLLDFEPPPEEVIASDQKRLVVDTYARYRIIDPLLFYQTVGTEDGGARPAWRAGQRQPAAGHRQRDPVGAAVAEARRRSCGRSATRSPPRPSPSASMSSMSASAAPICRRKTARRSMPACSSERQQQAAQYRGEGAEAAQTVRANADRERTVILADAQRNAQKLRGDGDAQASRSTPRRSVRIRISSPFTARCRPIAMRLAAATRRSCSPRTAASSASSKTRRSAGRAGAGPGGTARSTMNRTPPPRRAIADRVGRCAICGRRSPLSW